MNLGVSRRIALTFALFAAVAEVVRNWGDWGYWPFWLVDYLIVAFLLYGWWRTRRDAESGRPFLSSAWGFTCAVFYMSFFSHLERIQAPGHGPLNEHALTAIIGVMLLTSVAGLVASLSWPRSA